MPYVLHPPMNNGVTPSYSWAEDESYQPLPGEILVGREEFHALVEQPWGSPVWDSATNQLRKRTDAEKLDLTRQNKEAELRDAAERNVATATRGFERDVVVHQSATGAGMTQEEREIRATMQANYVELKDLISQVHSASSVEEVNDIAWTPPGMAQTATFAETLAQAEEVVQAARQRRKKPKPAKPSDPLEALTQRVADIEAELDARTRIFE